MLVLTRREGQSIVIRDDIRITVTQVRGGRVRIGVEAPAAVEVLREELTEEGQDARIEALIARTWGEQAG